MPSSPATSYVLRASFADGPRESAGRTSRLLYLASRATGLTGARDAAIIAIGSEVDLSVSEMIALDVADLAISDDGTGQLTIRKSQTDPEAEDDVASPAEEHGAQAAFPGWTRPTSRAEPCSAACVAQVAPAKSG